MKRTWIWFLLLISFAGCVIPSEFSRLDLNGLYDPAVRFTQAEGQAFHLNDSITKVIMAIQCTDLTYKKSRPDNPPTARLLITWSLSETYENIDLLKKDSTYITDTLMQLSDKTLQPAFNLKLKNKGTYLFSAVIVDLNANRDVDFFLPIDKDSTDLRENFFLCTEDEELIFGNRVSSGQTFRIKSIANKSHILYGRYYNRQFPIAIPPYAMEKGEAFKYKADSTFSLNFSKGITIPINFKRKGFYHFQSDTADKQGFTVFVGDRDYPHVSLPEHILEPLQYITTSKEYKQLTVNPNTKLAVDSFWLFHAGYTDRAKNLIYRYYKRVEEANILFTSYLEGWKTDRGMIYIIFGPPSHVFRASNVENWTYGEITQAQSLRFSFVRVNNPFTNNDFSLMRNPMYKESYFNSVELWRR